MNAGELRGLTIDYGAGTEVVFTTEGGAVKLEVEDVRVEGIVIGPEGNHRWAAPPRIVFVMRPVPQVPAGKPEEEPNHATPGSVLNEKRAGHRSPDWRKGA